MKIFLLSLILLFPFALHAQFPVPQPAVPVDGGLSMVLIAGAAIGYKAYKKGKKQPIK